ncbi:MAG: hypothetical protein J1G04_01985 [Clostridiales bacterium]|nr:hypothetical protein [Clostridiales bacterium]
MKDKRTYSLTAKERKARRRAQAEKQANGSFAYAQTVDNGETIENAIDTRKAQEQAMLASQTGSRKTAVMVGAIACVAIVLILVALIVPVIAYVVNPYVNYKSVIARFDLSNGMTLEFVIEEDEYDTAATNFIFLAKNKYFDNTVFYDAQSGWLRFGGYEEQPAIAAGSSSDHGRTHHHAQNEDYCNAFSVLPNNLFANPLNKFGYKLNADVKGTSPEILNDIGVLAYLYSDTSTEFQFSYQEQATNTVPLVEGGQNTLEPTMVGHALNTETINNLVSIAKTAQLNSRVSSGYKWMPPSPNIVIQRVKVYNLDKSKWNDFNFISYMNGKDSSGAKRLNRWTGQVG